MRTLRSAAPFRIIAIIALAAAPVGALAADASETPAGWLGASLGTMPPALDDSKAPGGVVITQIVEGSPADKAGLRGRDVVLSVNGVRVSSPQELIRVIKSLPPESWVGLTIDRRGFERQFDVRLGERPSRPASMRFVRGWVGAAVMDLPPKLRAHFGAPEDAGVMVRDLADGGPAEAAGIELGDVIYAVDGEPVDGPATFARLIADAGVDNTVEISLGREGASLTIECVIGRDADRPDPR